ncbi:MAG: peptidylprolyl isomerase [Acidimicrobiia bacterium]
MSSTADKRARQKQGHAAAREERIAIYRRARRRRILVWALVVALVVGAGVVGFMALTGDDSGDAARATEPTSLDDLLENDPESLARPENCDLSRTPDTENTAKTYDAEPPMTIDPAKTYTAVLDTTCGEITLELDAASAPVATNNFVFLAREGFYDGTTWHRVVDSFVIQGGDPEGTGGGGPGYEVAGEVPTDGYPEGSVAAAKTETTPNGSFGSQFFIVTADGEAPLPNEYARFATVTEGLDVARDLETFNNPADPSGAATEPLYIFSVSITEA